MAITYPDLSDTKVPNQDLIDIRKIFGIPGDYLLSDSNQYYTDMNDGKNLLPVEGIGSSSAVDNLFKVRQDDDRGITGLIPTFSSLPGDLDNFRLSQLEGTSDYFPPTTTLDKTKNFFMEKFFPTKVQGTLGDRLQKQYDTMSKFPTPLAGLAGLRNPFNPDSPNYNINLPQQLNYYESSGLIGRDPQSGGLKYGPDSVLAGKNVISGFGTNNPELALKNYIEKMEKNKKVSAKHKAKKLKQAKQELKNLQDNTEDKTPKMNFDEIASSYSGGSDRGEFDTGPDRGGSSLDQSVDSQVRDDEGNYYD
jgi:hypothetical protein